MRIFGFDIELRKATPDKQGFANGVSTSGLSGMMPDTTFVLFYSMYRKSSDLHRVITEISQTSCKSGFQISDGEEIQEDKEIQDYLNFEDSFKMTVATFIRDICVSGNAFLLKMKSITGVPIGLQALDPRTMTVKIDKYGTILGYRQQVGTNVQDFKPEDIKHLFLEKDPDNESLGLSPMEGMITDVLADNEAGLTNYHYFKNSAVPGHLVVLEPGLTVEVQNQVISDLKKHFAGGRNKGKIGIMSGLKDIKKIQDGSNEMQYEILRRFTTERVCAGYGVPKIILGYTDGVNYTNADIQYKRFIENTIIPRETEIENRLTQIIADVFPKKIGLKIVIPSDHIDDFIMSVDTVIKQVQYGLITINEAREELRYDKYEGIEEADIPLITKNLDKLSDVGLSAIPNLNGET